MYKKTFALFITFVICLLIFLFSQQPGSESEKIASNFFIRKLGHFSEYAVLGFFSFAYLQNIFLKSITKSNFVKTAIISLVFCALYACSDEYHQTFIVGRYGNAFDVLIDSSGALIGIFVSSFLFYTFIVRKIKK